MPTGAVGTVLFFSTIVELPVILFSYKFMDRFSGRTLMLLAFAIMVAQFLLYATAPNAFVAVVTMLALRAIGSTLFGMILLKIVRGVVQVRSVSTALGVISATDAMSAILRQHRTIAEASAVESPIRQETIGFPAHFFARAHNFKPPGRACQPEADSPMRT